MQIWMIWPNASYAIGLHFHHHNLQALLSLLSVCCISGLIIDGSKFLCDTYFGILPPLIHSKKHVHVVFIWHLMSVFVAGTCIFANITHSLKGLFDGEISPWHPISSAISSPCNASCKLSKASNGLGMCKTCEISRMVVKRTK